MHGIRRTLWGSIILVLGVIIVSTIFLVARQPNQVGVSRQLSGALASFTPTDIMPDGNTLLGYATPPSAAGASIALLTVATGKVQRLAAVTNIPSAVVTDGRFVVWDAPQLTALDLQTRHIAVIPGYDSQRRQIITLAQGQLLWETLAGNGWQVARTDLVANMTQVLIPATAGPVYGSWPYLLYPLATTWHLDDVAQHQDVTLATIDVTPGALVGTTVFGIRSTNGNVQDDEIVALQHADQPHATWQQLVTVATTEGISYQANDRLVVWQVGYNHLDALQGKSPPILQAYDRTKQQPTSFAGTGNAHFFFHDRWLVIVSAQHVVTVIDSAHVAQ